MKKCVLATAVFLTLASCCIGQATRELIAQQQQALANAASDTARIDVLLQLGGSYRFSNIDSSLFYINWAGSLAKKTGNIELEARALSDKGSLTLDAGNIPQAYTCMMQSFNIVNGLKIKNAIIYISVMNRLGNLFMELGEYDTSIYYYRLSAASASMHNNIFLANELSNIGNDYELMRQLDSAQAYQLQAFKHSLLPKPSENNNRGVIIGELLGRLANIQRDLGHYDSAIHLYSAGADSSSYYHDLRNLSALCLNLGQTFNKLNKNDSGFYYARKALEASQSISMKKTEYQAAELLSTLFTSSAKADSALVYLALSQKIKNELYGPDTFRQLQKLALRAQQQQLQLQQQNEQLKYRYTIIAILIGLCVILIVAFILWRNYRRQKSSNVLLNRQKTEIELQRNTLEDKNHELEIETALERVRTVAMGMRTQSDLLNICKAMFEELKALGFDELRNTMINILDDDEQSLLNYDYSNNTGASITNFSYNSHASVETLVKMSRGAKDAFVEFRYSGDELEQFKAFRVKNGELPDARLNTIPALFYYFYSIGVGSTGVSTFASLPQNKIEVLRRFRNVFDLAYRRYVDITQAEAQAREARVEASLEKMRAVVMAMFKSDELSNICEAMFNELAALGFATLRNVQVAIRDDKKQSYTLYAYSNFERIASELAYDSSPIVRDLHKQMGESPFGFYEREYSPEEMVEWRRWRQTIAPFKDSREATAGSLCWYMYGVGHGHIGISTFDAIPKEQIEVVKRFKNVFALCYRRFADLQKAEAQAREAQVEAALEKVRSRTMAMQHSDELLETALVLYQQFDSLGEKPLQITIGVIDTEIHNIEFWATNSNLPGDKMYRTATGSLDEPFLLSKIFAAWQEGKKSDTIVLAGKELEGWQEYRQQMSGEIERPPNEKGARYVHLGLFSKGAISISTDEKLSGNAMNTLERFAAVFDGTYTRFLDLKKAEAQAREAQIEASLERVRSGAMAMHSSDDLSKTVNAFFKELKVLGIRPIRCGVGQVDAETRTTNLTTTTYAEQGESINVTGRLKQEGHPVLEEIFNHWMQQKEYHPVLTGNDINAYYNIAKSQIAYPNYSPDITQYGNHFYFKEGFVFAWTEKELPEDDLKIFRRFTSVLSLTYRRYIDIKDAEAQTREAQIEAALERVRSRTLAMQKSDELAETAAVLFRQMTGLGIEPNRLYIGITREDTSEIEFWITDEDGTKVSTMFAGDANKNISIKMMRDAWIAHKKSIVIDMQGEELSNYFHYLGEVLHVPFKGGLQQTRRVQYISFFSSGFIGMASPDEQPQATTDLLDRFAYVFNLTFARFTDLKMAELHAIQAQEDLIKLQVEKRRAEDALTDLHATQKQLIQSEKMASLGELTAGIAHEIQNPLNFVNNFSEVSVELLEELKQEAEAGHKKDVIAIANDLAQNLEKINHHGKRADGIVKGMLQHSRTSSGQKEPTDINILADEYLRLSYHGLRAKDKSFNASLVTHFQEVLPKVTVVQQDVGRVLLNLLNNAFYAVKQKAKTAGPNYKPCVEVTTSSNKNQVSIIVKDNGNGIPDDIKDKIMQPFFTTKPTGEGTGLGLSLSYDIVKAHGGNIAVNSSVNQFTEFIITLPI